MINSKSYFDGKIKDLIRRQEKGEWAVFSPFLTMEECAEAVRICDCYKSPRLLFGGYAGSERKMLAVSSADEAELLNCFPISLLQFTGAGIESLTNRDVLGALMATGIKREVLGDIIARDGRVFLFVSEHIKDFLIQNLDSVGRCSVKLKEVSLDTAIPECRFEEMRVTVASLRIDAVVSALGHCSREQSNCLIDDKKVFLNHDLIEKRTKELSTGDCLVVRGIGKWLIDECGDLTKKGRVVLKCRKYI